MRLMHRNLIVAVMLSFSACALGAAPNKLSRAEKKEGWQLLFDGRSFDGWKANESPETFKIEDGAIVVNGPRAHLFYTEIGRASCRERVQISVGAISQVTQLREF